MGQERRPSYQSKILLNLLFMMDASPKKLLVAILKSNHPRKITIFE